MTEFKPPRQAQIIHSKYLQFGPALVQMGLPTRQFRVVKEDRDLVFIHPEDLSPACKDQDFPIRRDLIEFAQQDES